MNIIANHEPLHSTEDQISFLSYNILLPNNTEGWWIPKCYPPHTPPEHTTWAYRKNLLLQQLLHSSADIIFLQEVAQSSWKEDFHDLLETGYEGTIHAKNNLFRCATFVQPQKIQIVHTKHCFRTLVQLATWKHGYIGLINVHLSGGPHPKIRIAQIHEALDALRKLCVQEKISPESMPVVMGGDFNCNPLQEPLQKFLHSGQLSFEDRDPTYPDTALTQKGKKHVFPSFFHAYATYDSTPPPTLYGRPLINDFCGEHNIRDIMRARQEGTLSSLIKPEVHLAIRKLFEQYATHDLMDTKACEQWIMNINGALHGGEWLALQKLTMPITAKDFASIYIQNLTDGLWWSLDWDLHAHSLSIPRSQAPMHQETLDHFLVRKLTVCALYDIPVPAQGGLPNSMHPSDHLPIGMIIERE